MAKINDLKADNIQRIRGCFYNKAVWTKSTLSKASGISQAGVTNILAHLLKEQEIVYVGEAASTGGRKSKQYQLYKDASHLLTVVLKRRHGAYLFRLQRCNLFHEILEEEVSISLQGAWEEVESMIERQLKMDERLRVICISVPGICRNGSIEACDFERLEGINVLQRLSCHTSAALVIENDVNAACIGFYHRCPSCSSVAMLYQPAVKYVGCGMVIDGKLYNGNTHFAGELRYLPFLTHEEQEELRKSDPLYLLELQAETLCCVLNPKIIGICSDVAACEGLRMPHIPPAHRPQIAFIKDLDSLLLEGLYQMGIHASLHRAAGS